MSAQVTGPAFVVKLALEIPFKMIKQNQPASCGLCGSGRGLFALAGGVKIAALSPPVTVLGFVIFITRPDGLSTRRVLYALRAHSLDSIPFGPLSPVIRSAGNRTRTRLTGTFCIATLRCHALQRYSRIYRPTPPSASCRRWGRGFTTLDLIDRSRQSAQCPK